MQQETNRWHFYSKPNLLGFSSYLTLQMRFKKKNNIKKCISMYSNAAADLQMPPSLSIKTAELQ